MLRCSEPLSPMVSLPLCDRSRPWGRVELGPGWRSQIESNLRAYAFSDEPVDFLDSFAEEGWWVGLRFSDMAKCVYVQKLMFLEDGWKIPFNLFEHLIEHALCLEEASTPVAKSSADLMFHLFGDSDWFARGLRRCKQFTCNLCGAVPRYVCRRSPRRGEKVPWSEVYCASCFYGAVDTSAATMGSVDCEISVDVDNEVQSSEWYSSDMDQFDPWQGYTASSPRQACEDEDWQDCLSSIDVVRLAGSATPRRIAASVPSPPPAAVVGLEDGADVHADAASAVCENLDVAVPCAQLHLARSFAEASSSDAAIHGLGTAVNGFEPTSEVAEDVESRLQLLASRADVLSGAVAPSALDVPSHFSQIPDQGCRTSAHGVIRLGDGSCQGNAEFAPA